jgi:hypothetical protein
MNLLIFGVEKAIGHYEFNNFEIDCYILPRRIQIHSGLSWEVRSGRIQSKTGPDPQHCNETTRQDEGITVPNGLLSYYTDFHSEQKKSVLPTKMSKQPKIYWTVGTH